MCSVRTMQEELILPSGGLSRPSEVTLGEGTELWKTSPSIGGHRYNGYTANTVCQQSNERMEQVETWDKSIIKQQRTAIGN